MIKKMGFRVFVGLFCVLFAEVASADLLDGMGAITSWTDYENQAGDMPGYIWGNSDTEKADKIGLRVEFENGIVGTVVYTGVANFWNSSFGGLGYDSATGFFESSSDVHFLNNVEKGGTLPMAWSGCSMAYTSNFDLDYSEANGSNFRAETTGWGSATFTTYSSVAAVPEPVVVLLVGLGSLLLVGYRRFLNA